MDSIHGCGDLVKVHTVDRLVSRPLSAKVIDLQELCLLAIR